MKKYRLFSTGLMCAIATSVSAQISALPADFKSNVSKPAQTETEIPAYTGVADADPMWLTSEERCRRFVGETFYRIGECSELKIVDNRLRLIPLSDSKYVFRGTIVVPGKIRNGYFGTDSLLLNETEEHALLKARLQAKEADKCEDLGYLKRAYEYNKSSELRNRIEQVRFMQNYYDKGIMGYGTISHHPYGTKFAILQDSLSGIHYIQASLIKDQFVAAKYYDRIRNSLVGKNVCFLRNLPQASSDMITDAYSDERIPIEYSYLNADISKSRKQLYLCKDIVVHGKQPTLCAIIEKGETRFLASIERHLLGIDEENFRYKHGVKLQDKHFLLPESAFDAEEQRLIRDEQAKIQANEDARKAAAAKEKAAEANRKAELIRRFGTEAGTKIAQGRVELGMSKAMCREAWGSPTRRQLSKTLTGTSEIWYYTRTNRRLVFINDKLVEIFG